MIPHRSLPVFAACLAATLALGCEAVSDASVAAAAPAVPAPERAVAEDDGSVVLAGGCFWCVEAVFEPLAGVEDVVSGYAGGSPDDATYDLVAAAKTEHAEVVRVDYDPEQVSFGQLLQVFFATHDPTTADGQHPDYGPQYRPAVFVDNADERAVVEAYIAQLDGADVFDEPVVTGIEELTTFYPAEDYHQDFVERNPTHPYVVQWALPKVEKVEKQFPQLLSAGALPTTEEGWRARLTDEEFYVLRQDGTERPFTSPLNDVKQPGLFSCAGCGMTLFETATKFDSGTGWPSFYAPVDAASITEVPDTSHGMVRTEVECASCEGHLGHVFNDGPEPTGLRYCINGVALDFTPTAPTPPAE